MLSNVMVGINEIQYLIHEILTTWSFLNLLQRMVERKLTSDSDQEEDYSNDLLLTLFDLYLTLGLFLHNGEVC